MSSAPADRLLALSTLHILSSSTSFNAVRPAPLATLTHVAARYIELLAESAKRNAEQAGRATCTGWDLVGVLEELDGPGAVEGLFGWCRENVKRRRVEEDGTREAAVVPDQEQTQETDETSRLADVARVLDGTPNLVQLSGKPR